MRKWERLASTGTCGWLKVTAAASPGTEFAGKKTDERKLHPLGHAERAQELLFGVLEGKTNGVDRGNRQASTSLSAEELAARYR
jgi:hypothetical protein